MFITVKPKGVDFWDNEGKSTAVAIKKHYNLLMNASFFNMDPALLKNAQTAPLYFAPVYATKCNGEVLNSDVYSTNKYCYAWDDGGIPIAMDTAAALKSRYQNIFSAISCIWHGEAYGPFPPAGHSTDTVNKYVYFGLTADNRMVIGCERISMLGAQAKLLSAGCISGIICDGGGSAQLYTDTESEASSRIVRMLIGVNIEREFDVIEPDWNWAYGLTPRSVTDALVLHHAAGNGTAEAIHKLHLSKGWAGIAYHYYVRKDGSIYRGRPEDMKGGHVVNHNGHTIGICFEGDFTQDGMSEAQLEAGQKLVADIRKRYPDIAVKRHNEFGGTICPGGNFPFVLMVNPVDGSPEDEGDVEDKPADWAAEAWQWAQAQGLMDGTMPQEAMTREMAATVMYRFAQKYGLN